MKLKQEHTRILQAILITIIVCSVIFAGIIWIFGKSIFGGSSAQEISQQALISDHPVCTADYTPVCGMDGKTYSNTCLAHAQGVVVKSRGICDVPGPSSSGGVGIPHESTGTHTVPITPEGVTTPISSSPSRPKDENTICTQEYAPVCGIDGSTYANACMAGEMQIAHIGECDATESKYQTGAYMLYNNPPVGYSLAFPKYVYYAGTGPRDGATHSIMVGLTASGIEAFETAPVQIWFYKKSPTTPPSDQSRTLPNGVLYIKNNDSTGNPKISQIMETVLDSAR